MRYDFPETTKPTEAVSWPASVGGIPVQLGDGTFTEVPVLQGVNVLAIGVTGSGKTHSFTLPAAEILMANILGLKSVFFEIKWSYLQRFLRENDKVISYDLSAVSSCHRFQWSMIREIQQAEDAEAEMKQIAAFLFSDLLVGANQNLGWIDAAQDAFIGALRVAVDCFQEPPSNWVFINSLRNMSIEGFLTFLARHPRNQPILRDFGYDINARNGYKPTRRAEDTMFFVTRVLEKFCGSFQSEGMDTIHEFMNTRDQNLFIRYDLATAESSRNFVIYFLKKLKDLQMSNSRTGKSPMLFCLDEIDKLSSNGKAADFDLFQLVTLGREHQAQVILSTQSLHYLYCLAPDFNSHLAEGGINGFPEIVAFRVNDPYTIQTLQRLFGSSYQEHRVYPASRYAQPAVKHELLPNVPDAELTSLKTGEAYVKMLSSLPQKVKVIL